MAYQLDTYFAETLEKGLKTHLVVKILMLFTFLNVQAQNIIKSKPKNLGVEAEWDWYKNTSRELLFTDSSAAFNLLRHYIDSNSNSNSLTIAHAWAHWGSLLAQKANYSLSMPKFRRALNLYKPTNDSLLLGYTYRNLGYAHFQNNALDSALDHFYPSLLYLDSNRFAFFYALTARDLGKALFVLHNYNFSQRYLQSALKHFLQDGRMNEAAAALNDLGYVLAVQGSDKYNQVFEQGIRLSVQLGDSALIGRICGIKAWQLLSEWQTDAAWKYLNRAQNIYRNKIGDDFLLVLDQLMAEYYLQNKQLELAEFRATEALKALNAKSFNAFDFGHLRERLYNTLYSVYYELGDYKKAIFYADLYKRNAQQLLEESYNNKVRFIDREMQNALKSQQLDRERIQNLFNQERIAYEEKRNRLFLMATAGLSVFLLLVLWLFSRVQRSRKQLRLQNEFIHKQREELKLLNQNKDRLFSIIGHDLRGPIGNLSNLLSFIPNEGDVIGDESREILDLTHQGLLESLNLLENLLIWAKEQKDEIKLTPKYQTLEPLVTHIRQLYSPLITQKGINLQNHLSPDFHAFFDANTIETVLRNIISNAIKYCPNGSMIRVVAHSEDEMVVLKVEDNGPGVPAHVLKQLNVDRERGQGLKERLEGNLGLGLRMSRDFVEANGGSFTIEAELGKGSKFIITLPAKKTL